MRWDHTVLCGTTIKLLQILRKVRIFDCTELKRVIELI